MFEGAQAVGLATRSVGVAARPSFVGSSRPCYFASGILKEVGGGC